MINYLSRTCSFEMAKLVVYIDQFRYGHRIFINVHTVFHYQFRNGQMSLWYTKGNFQCKYSDVSSFQNESSQCGVSGLIGRFVKVMKIAYL